MSATTIESMINWIDNNITKHPTLEEMSEYVGYSPYYCSVKFHENVGMTFKQYLASRRLCRAADEICRTSRRCIDIALDCGYASQESFTRAFASRYGCTPMEYRKMNLNKRQE